MDKAEQILDKHINEDDLNFIFHEKKQLWQELLNAVNEALRQPLVSGALPCHHNFIQKDTYWKSCTHCGMLAPLGQ